MNSSHWTTRLRYVGGMLLFVLGYHLALSEPGQPVSSVLPVLCIVLWGDLVREVVAIRTPATDDATVRARRGRWMMYCLAQWALTTAGVVAAIVFDAVPNKPVAYVWIALSVAIGAAGLGFVSHDASRATKAQRRAERREAPVIARVLVPMLSLLIVGYALWNAWVDWSSQRAVSSLRLFGFVLIIVTMAAGVLASWQFFDAWEDRAPEHQ